MSLPITAMFDPRRLSTEELHRLRDALTAELQGRDELGESSLRPDQFERLLARLGDCAQAKALRAAAAQDGRVSREKVFEFLGRPADGRLNGFRKPIDRAVTALAAAGDFPVVTPGPLHVDYGTGVSAEAFYVRAADLPALRAAVGT
ncbi:hypothetical protein AD017_32415 (plasmid) [Pseudonocardia sp. EC080619-01]|uniref:hypothetical protein n=1 Tax=Pseudonocardia sp. EC080619-01 TaxID=1096856 RepID=UPI0007063515|nr:hypothetical protein [Pseudonocardia sp. EC080619-01]ALL85852.1 hypothetical protein AD017_32415 [Pseudonocardia sp. EC080619-01]